MRTNRQRSGSLGRDGFLHTDEAGVEWTVSTEWHVIGGRAECTALTLDSGGLGRVTSTLVRQVERKVRDQRDKRGAKVRRIALERRERAARLAAKGAPMGASAQEVGRRATRQVAAYEASEAPSPGRRRRDDEWLARVEAMAAAWAEGRPMLHALEELEPGFTANTYRKRMDRARAWDREHGPGLLEGVGRARRQKGQER